MAANPDLHAFIRFAFRSIWSLELLLHLKRMPERCWTHAEMVTELRGSDLAVTAALDGLAVAGLVVREEDGSASYRPATPDLARLADEAEALYTHSPDAVRRLIVSAANPGLAAFADAFRLRKD